MAFLISFLSAILGCRFRKKLTFQQDYQLQQLLLSPQDQPPVLLLHICLCGHMVNQMRKIIWLKNSPYLFGQQLPKHTTQAVNVRCYINISVKFRGTVLETPKE